MGITEVGNRWEFLGNSLLENGAFREFPWNSPIQGRIFRFTEGIFTYRGVVVFTGSISFIAPPVATSSLRASEI